MLYQQEHPELKVELRTGMEEEAALTRTDAIKQLNTELLSGSGPDLIVMDGLSVEKYTDMGLLLPVDLNMSEDAYFTNIAETYRKDGNCMQYRQIFCFMQCRERLVPPRKSVLRLLPVSGF